MNVLHFCSYYIGSKVYKELFHSLSKKGVSQDVYVPIRNSSHRNVNELNLDNVSFHYVRLLSLATRAIYLLKLILVTSWAFLFAKYRNYNVVHAHTLYADGIPAYLFCAIVGSKLVISVRNTDVNLGFRIYPQYKWLVRKALNKASAINFISPAHKKKFEEQFGEEYNHKVHLVPNGVQDFYVDNAQLQKKQSSGCVGLYVGRIDRNKNLKYAIKAFFDATSSVEQSRFVVVGGGYSCYQQFYGGLGEEYLSKVEFVPHAEKEALCSFYDQASVLIMPSHLETFGLVYVEAISRCLPIVYTAGQGVDGIFEYGEFGYSCDSRCIQDIAQAITLTLKSFPDGLGPFSKENPVVSFSWEGIANQYKERIYL